MMAQDNLKPIALRKPVLPSRVRIFGETEVRLHQALAANLGPCLVQETEAG